MLTFLNFEYTFYFKQRTEYNFLYAYIFSNFEKNLNILLCYDSN